MRDRGPEKEHTTLYSQLPGSPALKGITWGVILWLIAQVMVMPMMATYVGLRISD